MGSSGHRMSNDGMVGSLSLVGSVTVVISNAMMITDDWFSMVSGTRAAIFHHGGHLRQGGSFHGGLLSQGGQSRQSE